MTSTILMHRYWW